MPNLGKSYKLDAAIRYLKRRARLRKASKSLVRRRSGRIQVGFKTSLTKHKVLKSDSAAATTVKSGSEAMKPGKQSHAFGLKKSGTQNIAAISPKRSNNPSSYSVKTRICTCTLSDGSRSQSYEATESDCATAARRYGLSYSWRCDA